VATVGAVTATTAAELAAAVEIVVRYRERVAGLVTQHLDTDRDDLVGALYEGERALLGAERTLRRAMKLAET